MLDAVWLCKVAERQMLRPSFVPPRPIRVLRDLTRYRIDQVGARTAEKNRVQTLLEACMVLSVVAADMFGVSGRAMMEALIAGQVAPAVMADLAQRRMRSKIRALTEALTGRFTPHHGYQIRMHLNLIDEYGQALADLDARIGEATAPLMAARELLMSIPGVSRIVAEVLLAERAAT